MVGTNSGDTGKPGTAKQTGGLLGKAKSDKIVKKAITSKPKPARGGKGGKGGGTNHGLNTL